MLLIPRFIGIKMDSRSREVKFLSSSSASEMKGEAWERPELERVRTPIRIAVCCGGEQCYMYIWALSRVTWLCSTCSDSPENERSYVGVADPCLTDGRITGAS